MEIKKKLKNSKFISYNMLKKNSKVFGLNIKKYNILLKTSHKNNIQKSQNQSFFLIEKIKKYNNFNNTIKTYKSYRNLNGYPARGQRTHTNGKTKKKLKF
jgi:ribosomal protein S13